MGDGARHETGETTMLTKTILALSAALVLGTASAALAAEANDSTFGDQYSWSVPHTQYQMPAEGLSAFAAARPAVNAVAGEPAQFAQAKGRASDY